MLNRLQLIDLNLQLSTSGEHLCRRQMLQIAPTNNLEASQTRNEIEFSFIGLNKQKSFNLLEFGSQIDRIDRSSKKKMLTDIRPDAHRIHFEDDNRFDTWLKMNREQENMKLK
jgi:hypothetical protein